MTVRHVWSRTHGIKNKPECKKQDVLFVLVLYNYLGVFYGIENKSLDRMNIQVKTI